MIKEILEEGKHAGKLLIVLAIAVVTLQFIWSNDEAGAQVRFDEIPLSHSCALIETWGGVEVTGLPPNGEKPSGLHQVSIEWSQWNQPSTGTVPVQCTFDIAFYTHEDNRVLRPHPESVLWADSENNPVEVVYNNGIYTRFYKTLILGGWETGTVVCGTQIDVYRDNAPLYFGPITDFDTDDDGVVDVTYNGQDNRLVASSNWENPETCPVPPPTTTPPSTVVPPTTTPTEPPTTTTKMETTTTSTPDITSTTVNDTTTSTIQTSSTVGDTTSSTVSLGDPTTSTDPNGLTALPRTGSRDTGNTILLGLSLMAAGFLATLAHRRRRFSQ